MFTKKYIAAISGGPDSMSMLDQHRNEIEAVATVHYHKRTDADKDVACVIQYCNNNNIPIHILDVTQQMYDNIDNNNFQTKARIIRYNFFKEVCTIYNNYNVIIAHNYDDFMETAYYQRKRHSRALFYGIKDKTEIDGMKIYRPLINLRKSTLKRYCDEKKIPYAIDSTNTSDDYDRNRIRKIIGLWSTEEVCEFKQEINKYNKKNKKLLDLSISTYIEWKKLKYSKEYFENADINIAYQLIYRYYRENDITNISANKITQTIDFIKKGKPNAIYRITNELGISKKDNIISIINQDVEE